MSRKVNSAGFVIRTLVKEGPVQNYKYLLCHASGAGTTKGWGIPKGKQDDYQEPLLLVALREVQEETNLDLMKVEDGQCDGHIYYTYTLKDKIVTVFTFTDDSGSLINYPFSCPSEYAPGKPEIDGYEWVSLKQAIKMATESQKGLFKHIEEFGI